MSDLSSDGDFDYEDPKPVIMAKRQPRCSESSDDGLEIDCLKDTSDEEPIIVKNKTKKFVPPILASPLAKVTTAKNVKLQKPKRHPNGSPVVLAQPSKSAPSASPLPKSAKPAPAPKANVKCFNMEDNLTATTVKDLPMKPLQPTATANQDSAVGKLKGEILFLRAARYAIV